MHMSYISAKRKNTLENLSEYNLFKLYDNNRSDIELRNFIAIKYDSLTKYCAGKLYPKYFKQFDFDDLYGFGYIGMLGAIDRYDYKKGFKFTTYAVSRVKGEILDQIRKLSWAGYSLERTIKKYNNIKEQIEIETGKTPTKAKILKLMGRKVTDTTKDYNERKIVSIYNRAYRNGEYSDVRIVDMIEDDRKQVDKWYDAVELEKCIHDYIASIEKYNHKKAMILYFYEGLTQKEIADIFGFTESRISQMISYQFRLMREKLRLEDYYYNN